MNIKNNRYDYIVYDIITSIVMVFASIMLRYDFIYPNETPYLAPTLAISTLSIVLLSVMFGSYRVELRFFGFSELFRQFIISFLTGFILFLVKIFEIYEVAGSVTVIYCGLYFSMSCAIRGIPRFGKWLSTQKAGFSGTATRTLVIGGGHTGAMLIKHMQHSVAENLYPVGIIDDDPKKVGKKVAGVKVLGALKDVKEVVEFTKAEMILIAISNIDENEANEIFLEISKTNLPTKIYQNTISSEDFLSNNDISNDIKEVTIEDLLFRDPIDVNSELTKNLIKNNVVMVTGGAGSIGSELCRQVLSNDCKFLVIFDIHENGLYEINEELKNLYPNRYVTCLGSVRDAFRLERVFKKYKPSVVIHAAAHKHVPMMEINPFEAVKNNIMGTLNVIQKSVLFNCKKFILISSDKAVNPTNVMGATKRACELLVKAYNNQNTEMVAVRFGNVLGSNGSVIPLFKKQIEKGGPVTVTHKDMTRYFMTIKEAVSLVLLAGASAKGSELFVLDMGKPVKIYDLACNLIKLSGKTPNKDIHVHITGLRPGEKLYEELQLGHEVADKTSHKKIFIMRDEGVDRKKVSDDINLLQDIIDNRTDEQELRDAIFSMIDDNKE